MRQQISDENSDPMPWKEKARIYATMPIRKVEAFDEINDDWNAYIEQVEQYLIANEIKGNKSGSDANPMTGP